MNTRQWVLSLCFLGTAILASALTHYAFASPPADDLLHHVLDAVLLGGAGICLLYGAYWHASREIVTGGYGRLAAWLVGSVVLFVVVGLVSVFMGSSEVTRRELFDVVHLTASIGAAAGLLVGTVEAVAIRHSRDAARAEAKAKALRDEQERIYRVNDLLRHYVLNSLTVIEGRIDHLSADLPAAERSKLAVVERRVETIDTLVGHIRTLSTALQIDAPRTEYDLAALLESTVEGVELPQAVTVDVPAGLPPVLAASGVERALGLLLEALADTLDAATSLRITARESDSTVVVGIDTDGERTLDRDSVGRAGSETEVKFTIAREFVESTGEFRFGDDPAGATLCELVLEVDAEQHG